MSRLLGPLVGVALLAAAAVLAYIGAADVLEAVTGADQDSPSGALVAFGALFLLIAAPLAWLGLRALGRPRGR